VFPLCLSTFCSSLLHPACQLTVAQLPSLHSFNSAQPTYKLTYFNGRGLAEPIRLIFVAAGVKFDDVRFTANHDNDTNPSRANDQFIALKATGKSPYGQVPLLEVGDISIGQSQAIVRYLSGQFKMAGSDALEAAKCDELFCAVTDVQTAYYKTRFGSDDVKAAESKKFKEVVMPRWGACFDALVGKKEFLVGNTRTYADIVVYYFFWLLQQSAEFGADIAQYKDLSAFVDRIGAIPAIKAHVDARPETKF
jgi:glutathione S-transferase